MPYSFYHVLHIVSLILFVSSMTIVLRGNSESKLPTIIVGVSSLSLLVSGMGLLARIGGEFQSWVSLKLGIWLVLSVMVPVAAKRCPEKKGLVFKLAFALLLIAVYAVSTKLM